MNDTNKFYHSLLQDVAAIQSGSEDGDTQEQTFTRMVVDMLSEAGETENVSIAYDEKDFGKKGQHKINAYAISDNYETVDLFITIFNNVNEISSVLKSDIDTAVKRISNFFRKAVYGDYVNEVAESSPIFEFANTLANYRELKDNLVRVNAFVITNGEYNGEIPNMAEINGCKVFYRILDIKYLYQISEQSRVPIEIDFTEEGWNVPCLSSNSNNSEYKTYIAILPGQCLASLYERYGARLLEQNVRSFLQFTGKINKGIRETIKNEPQMFLAFNNGIAATADHIELDETGSNIRKINNLQIVNGGQTTASIYTTAKKDKADISNIYVQVKFSIIENPEQYSDIVSRISRYANTQNKVNDADFSANNPTLIELEKLSRYVLTPTTPSNNIQTCWFFERARGQFKTLRGREGFTKSRLKAFDLKYPKSQVFTKVELAKYINAYNEVWNGKKLVVGPHIVVRGNEKNYARFINDNLPDSIKKINSVYFEDTIAKAILFKATDKRYGTKLSGNNIGEMKQVVVPYAISLLNIITKDRLNLYLIWKSQQISQELSDFMYNIMKQVNAFILEKSPVSHYIEWAKKEECWNAVRNYNWQYDIDNIISDLVDPKNPPKRNIVSNSEDDEKTRHHEEGIIKSIPFSLWKKIEAWGRESGYLAITQQSAASDLGYKIKNNRRLNDSDINRGMRIFDIVCQYSPELLEEADSLSQQDAEITQTSNGIVNTQDITLELVKQMVDWDRKKRVLEDWKWKAMHDVVEGKKELTDRMKYVFYLNLEKLKSKGFPD